MGYSPNVVSAGDYVFINGVKFKVKYDFNLAQGDKNLLLQVVRHEPQTYMAYNEKGMQKEVG